MARKGTIQRSFTFDGKRYWVSGKDEKEVLVKKELLPDLGYAAVSKVKPIQLQKILNSASGYSASYIKKIYQIICGVFHSAYVNDLILEDPTKALVCPSGKKKIERRALTQEERDLTFKTAEWSRGGLFVMIMLYCGLRPGEVAALRWNDIDLEKNILSVNKALKSDGTIGDPKSQSGIRKVPVPDALKAYLDKFEHKPFDLVCPNMRGEHLSSTSMRDLWLTFKSDMEKELNGNSDGNISKRLSDNLTMYCYRHTYCTDLQAAGVPINVAKELMGHSSISITAQIYTHKSDVAFNSAAELINSFNSDRVQGVVHPSASVAK